MDSTRPPRLSRWAAGWLFQRHPAAGRARTGGHPGPMCRVPHTVRHAHQQNYPMPCTLRPQTANLRTLGSVMRTAWHSMAPHGFTCNVAHPPVPPHAPRTTRSTLLPAYHDNHPCTLPCFASRRPLPPGAGGVRCTACCTGCGCPTGSRSWPRREWGAAPAGRRGRWWTDGGGGGGRTQEQCEGQGQATRLGYLCAHSCWGQGASCGEARHGKASHTYKEQRQREERERTEEKRGSPGGAPGSVPHRWDTASLALVRVACSTPTAPSGLSDKESKIPGTININTIR